MIDEAKDGSLRVLVDSESWTISKDGGNNYLVAQFRFVRDGVPGEPVVYITEAPSCVNRTGQLWQRAIRDGKWTTVNQYWWSKHGQKLYDSIGGALCDIFEVRMEESTKKPTKESGTTRTL
jgi:hypothetical protein